MGFQILKSLGLLIEGVLFLSLAYMVFWLWLKQQGANLQTLLTEHDNLAVSVSLAGFLFGCVLAFTGSVTTAGGSFTNHLNDVAKYALSILALQMVAVIVADKLIFAKFVMHDEICAKHNTAAAIGQAAVSVATGLILAGAFAAPTNGILLSMVWFVIGQVVLIAVAKAYQEFLTPYNDMVEIRQQNLAAGFALAGILIAVGYTVGHAVEGEFSSWQSDLLGVGLYVAVSLLLLAAMRTFTAKVIFFRADLSAEIARDKNIGVGVLEGLMYILAAMMIGFFLT